ncbi:MAG: hypothetical protein N2557_07535 [Hydrogenophilus sp.]|nr:hypothetical protein [Hydrogenophilus sp.]
MAVAIESGSELQKSADAVSEMERWQIVSFADILRALEAHPEWLARLRELILTSELLELPRKIGELLRRVEKMEGDIGVLKEDVSVLKEDVTVLKQDVAVLKEDVTVLKQDVAVLKEDVTVLKQDVAVLKEDVALLKQDVQGLKLEMTVLKGDVDYLKGEFGRFKGSDFERRVRERFAAYFGAVLKRGRLITQEQLMAAVDEAEEAGRLLSVEREEVFLVDALVEGMIRSSGKPVLLAIETSVAAYPEDIERARRRADVLAKVFGKETIPTVVCVSADATVKDRAQETGVLLICKELE